MAQRKTLQRALWLALVSVTMLERSPAQNGWVGSWATAASAITPDAPTLPAETLRQIVRLSAGGSALRVTFTNELGTDSLVITGAQVAGHAAGPAIQPGSAHPLRFGGQAGITIPPGAVAVSDPVELPVAPLSEIVVSMALPAQTVHTLTAHGLELQTNYSLPGDALASPDWSRATSFSRWSFLKNVEVHSPGSTAVVALGDSITDGYRSTPDTNRRWPDVLAERLNATAQTHGMAVLNEGISGNRILHDGAGPNALSRLDRDVLSQTGVSTLIVLEGINDIGRTAEPRAADDRITAQQIIVAYQQIIEHAHAHGIRVLGGTLTPFVGAGYASAPGEAMRQTVNAWIRGQGHFDGVLDFDAITRDPAHPDVLAPAVDSGDHLHPGDAGYHAMGAAIRLDLLH